MKKLERRAGILSLLVAIILCGCDQASETLTALEPEKTLYTPNPNVICNRTPVKGRAPHGLFLNAANLPTQNLSEVRVFVLPDPTNCGANIVVPWSAVDDGTGYDWSVVLNAAAPWIKAGKTVNLLVWGAAQLKEQEFGRPMTPDYVLRQVHTVSCRYFDAQAGKLVVRPTTPAFWEEGYQEPYKRFVRALVARFGREPWVGVMRFGIGVGAESYPANGVPNPANPCTRLWTSPPVNLNYEVWKTHSLEMVDFFATLATNKPVIVTVNEYFGIGRPFGRLLAQAAVVRGLGVGTQGLTLTQKTRYVRGEPCYADWCLSFDQAAEDVLLEVQTATQSSPQNVNRTGSLVPLLPFALKRGSDVVELYRSEWVVANNPKDPNYKKYGQAYRTVLHNAAKTLAGRE
jgi:hypothetical protein